jgi:hypothetical protein
MSRKPTRESKLSDLAVEHGWQLDKVGRRYRLVIAETGTVVADDWGSGDGLTLDDIERALTL